MADKYTDAHERFHRHLARAHTHTHSEIYPCINRGFFHERCLQHYYKLVLFIFPNVGLFWGEIEAFYARILFLVCLFVFSACGMSDWEGRRISEKESVFVKKKRNDGES